MCLSILLGHITKADCGQWVRGRGKGHSLTLSTGGMRGLTASVKGSWRTAVLHIRTPNSHIAVSELGLPPARAAHEAQLSWVLWKSE